MGKFEPVKKITVTEGDKTQDVFIAGARDRQELEYLEVAEKEKTADELRKKEPKEKPKKSKEEVAERLKWFNKRKEGRTSFSVPNIPWKK